MDNIFLTQNVWRTKDGRYVGDNDDQKRQLIAKAGTWIPYAEALEYGLTATLTQASAEPAPVEHQPKRAKKEEDDDDAPAKHARKK